MSSSGGMSTSSPISEPGFGPPPATLACSVDDVDQHRFGRRGGRRQALRASAAAVQPLRPGGQCPQRVGAALYAGARVVLADGVGHRGQPGIQRVGIGGEQLGRSSPPDLGSRSRIARA